MIRIRWVSLCDTSRGAFENARCEVDGTTRSISSLTVSSSALPAYVHEGKEPEAPKIGGRKRSKSKVRKSGFIFAEDESLVLRGVLTLLPYMFCLAFSPPQSPPLCSIYLTHSYSLPYQTESSPSLPQLSSLPQIPQHSSPPPQPQPTSHPSTDQTVTNDSTKSYDPLLSSQKVPPRFQEFQTLLNLLLLVLLLLLRLHSWLRLILLRLLRRGMGINSSSRVKGRLVRRREFRGVCLGWRLFRHDD